MARWTLTYLFGYLPQTFLFLYAALGLVGAQATAKRLVAPAVLFSLMAHVLRPYLPMGYYVPAFLVLLASGLVLFRLASVLEAVAAAAIGFILIAVADLLVVSPVLYVLDLDYEQIMASSGHYLVIGSLEGSVLAAAALLVRVKSIVVVPISRWEKALAQRRASK